MRFGIIGIIIVISICALPIIKLIILSLIYNFSAALCEPIADKKIVNIIEQMASTYQLLLAILFFVALLFIVGIAMMLKISNVGLMYQ